MSKMPVVLVIDDEPEEQEAVVAAGLGERATASVLHPRDVELTHLEQADLVLVDYLLENWEERDNVCLAMRPESGLALAVLLRDHADRSKQGRLTAFALHSAHLDLVRGRLPAASGVHVIARLNNMEWVFAKTESRRWDQAVLLANAVRALPRKWPEGEDDAAEGAALNLLGLSEQVAWFDRARRTIRDCQPPIHDLSGGAHDLLFVRWLLHQVLPFPSFLWRDEWVAARLRLTPSGLKAILDGGGQLAEELSTFVYTGLLGRFLGTRWWRAGVEQYVWNITEGRSVDVETLHGALKKRTKVTLETLESRAALVCLGEDFEPTGEFINPEQAVRLRPDHWPAFADNAWTTVDRAREAPLLAAVVDPVDAARLDEGEDGKK